jgi:dihydrofolate reductase
MATVDLDLSVSLDGYVAGPDDRLGGADGELRHRWFWAGGGAARPDGLTKQGGSSATIGARLTGRRTSDLADGWGGRHPARGVPVFVVTHDAPAAVPEGPTAFTFVTEGVERAVALARAAAGDKRVYGLGGAGLAAALLGAHLLDEIRLHLVPVLLRDGVRRFGATGRPVTLEQVEVLREPEATRLRYRVAREGDSPMARVIVHNAVTVNGAFAAPAPDTWLLMDAASAQASFEQLALADALVLGRKTYEGLAAVWPQLGDDPTFGPFAARVNAMPKYVASRTLSGPLAWNATLLAGDLGERVRALKAQHQANLIVSGCGEVAHSLTTLGLVDEFWFWLHPSLWPAGPRIFDGVGPVRLDLLASTAFESGVVWLRYTPGLAPNQADGTD